MFTTYNLGGRAGALRSVAFVSAVSSSLLATSSAALAPGVCRNGAVIDANRQIKVVSNGAKPAPTLYACRRESDRRLRMGQRFADLDSEYTNHIRLNRPYLAYQNAMVGKDSGAIYDVYVWNSKAGKLRSYPTGRLTAEQEADGPSGAEGVGPVTDMVLSETGHVAWIAWNTYTRVYEVWAQRTRSPVLVDSGSDIRPDTMRLRKRRFVWDHGGETRVADLG
jgi:hypothetical protein